MRKRLTLKQTGKRIGRIAKELEIHSERYRQADFGWHQFVTDHAAAKLREVSADTTAGTKGQRR